MKRHLVLSAGMCIALTVLSGCGGSGDSGTATGSSPATGSPPASGAPTGTTPAPAPVAGTPAPATPTPAPAPTPVGTPGSATIPSLASIPAGQQTGGSAAKSPSGYSDQLLTGRWATLGDGSAPANGCVDLPAIACANNALSFQFGRGYTATGNAATEISEGSFYRGAGCQAAGLVASVLLARDIAFDAQDTDIDDETILPASGQIAVRRGVPGAERAAFSAGDEAALEGLFASCPTLNPNPATPTTPDPESCTDSIQLRIEASPTGPVLLDDETSDCVPGTVPPAIRYSNSWTLRNENGLNKLP